MARPKFHTKLTKKERDQRQLEKFEVKEALAKMWRSDDPDYARSLDKEAFQLRRELEAKGILEPKTERKTNDTMQSKVRQQTG